MYLGLDVSTSIIGFCVLDKNGHPTEFSFLKLSKYKSMFEKARAFEDFLQTHYQSGIEKVYIEDKLSGGGAQSTILTLAAFHGIVRYIIRLFFGFEAIPIHPNTAKAAIKVDGLVIPFRGCDRKTKKSLTINFCKTNFPNFPYEQTKKGNPAPGLEDAADAWLTARACYLKGM